MSHGEPLLDVLLLISGLHRQIQGQIRGWLSQDQAVTWPHASRVTSHATSGRNHGRASTSPVSMFIDSTIRNVLDQLRSVGRNVREGRLGSRCVWCW
jgi:hypothetical protein